MFAVRLYLWVVFVDWESVVSVVVDLLIRIHPKTFE